MVFADTPEPWAIGFQDGVSPTFNGILELHNSIFFYLVIIAVLVFWMMGAIILHFNSNNSKITYKYLVHGTLIEVLWTIFPAIILIAIAIPSFKLLYIIDELVLPTITVKATGSQWYWSYEYSDYETESGDPIEFDSYMVPESDLELGQMRLLEVDQPVVLPTDTHVRFLITSTDVLHDFALPSAGIKLDAAPGRLNQASFLSDRETTITGQCSELCGVYHSFMPIVVNTVNVEEYLSWIDSLSLSLALISSSILNSFLNLCLGFRSLISLWTTMFKKFLNHLISNVLNLFNLMFKFERYLLFIIGAICFVSLITFLLPYSIKIDEIETFNWILGLDINKPLNLGNDLETIWMAGLFPWGVFTKSKLFINRLITPVLAKREVILKGFILISLTLLFIFFTYPLFNKYIVDILCTTISVLIFSFILDKGKLSDLKPIRYMQIILFTYIGTFLFVLFVLFIYQYISDNFIYCAPGDIVSTEVVTTTLETGKTQTQVYVKNQFQEGHYGFGAALGAAAKNIPGTPLQKMGMMLGVGTSGVFLGKRASNLGDYVLNNNVVEAGIKSAEQMIQTSPHANPDLLRVPSPGIEPFINSPLEPTEIISYTPLEGLLDNTLTSILWLSISLGLFFYIFFYRFFSAYFFKFFLALPFIANSRFAKYFQPLKDYNDQFYFSLLLILAFFIFGYLIIIYLSVNNLNENLDKYILVYTHLKFK